MLSIYRKLRGRMKTRSPAGLLSGRDARSGAMAIDFAIVAPVFFILVFGLIDISRAVFTKGVMLYAMEEASRWAAVNFPATAADIEAVALAKFTVLDAGNITAFSATVTDNGDKTKAITLQMDYTFEFMMPFISLDPITLSTEATILSREL
ncbi:MAG: pilus assembly protein [Proteobacteria bacterium]|nr:pilus assembly protein [Pseudomonadota bacterium]